MRVSLRFDEIAIKQKKTGPCIRCKKKTTKTKKFSQTINPFNKDASGCIKTAQQIIVEIDAEAAKWMKSSKLICGKCWKYGDPY